MKVEILMATYNGEKYLREQIDSILKQTFKDWKLIMRDDGSKDKTIEILNEYEKKDKRIKVLQDNKGNLGVAKNFEELLKNSSGEYVMFSDQDDYWMENKIEKYLKVLEKLDKENLKNPLLIHSNSYVCDKNLNILKKEFINSKIAKENNGNSYFFCYIVQGATLLVNRRMVELALPFLKSVKLHDRYFHLLSEFFGKRIFIDESLTKYRQHGGNEIGAKGSIVNKILKKRYFDKNDRELIIEISKKYDKILKKSNLKDIEKYIEVTDRSKNRIKRFLLSKYFEMKLIKRLFLLIKG